MRGFALSDSLMALAIVSAVNNERICILRV